MEGQTTPDVGQDESGIVFLKQREEIQHLRLPDNTYVNQKIGGEKDQVDIPWWKDKAN